MRKSTLAIAIVLMCAPVLARAQTPPASDPAALRREVEALNRDMEAAFNRGDLKAVAAFYADNAVVRTSRQVAAQGARPRAVAEMGAKTDRARIRARSRTGASSRC